MSNERKAIKSLRDRVKEFSVQLPFMEGREKGETSDLLGQVSTIRDYGFLTNEKGETYVCFIVDERSKHFYFGGTVLTGRLITLEEEGYHDAINEEGLPVLLTESRGKKSNLKYTNVNFDVEV